MRGALFLMEAGVGRYTNVWHDGSLGDVEEFPLLL